MKTNFLRNNCNGILQGNELIVGVKYRLTNKISNEIIL